MHSQGGIQKKTEVGKTYKAGEIWEEDKKKVNIYAMWTATSYEVIYDANGGQVTPDRKNIAYDGEYGSLPTPTKEGHTFKGWFTEITGGEPITSDKKYKTVGNQTIYAQWEIKTYQVTYNANNGTGAPNAQTKTWGQALPLSSQKPTRNGYTFVNWNTQANGTGTSYNAGASYTENEGVTLYAQWKQDRVLATTAITPSTYGESVNYSANGVTDWKIFLNDGTNIYIIASDYLPRSKMPSSLEISVGDGAFCVKGSSLSNLVNWLKDTTKWTAYASGTSGLTGTVTGGPTLEQFWSSYNKKYNTSYSNKQNLSSHTGYSNTLYFPYTKEWNSCYGYWLASPNPSVTNGVWRVDYHGSVNASSYNFTNYRSPSVSLFAIWYLCE